MTKKHAIHVSSLLVCSLAIFACNDDLREIPLDTTPPAELVNPFIGSGGHYFGFGSAFVGACRPHGLAKPGPDTSEETGVTHFHHFSGYHFDDEIIQGFSQVHIHGTGAVDYGALLLMPTSGFSEEKDNEWGYRSRFSKDDEIAQPGYYAVTLADHNIKAELTATRRCAFHRYTFDPSEASPTVIFDISHALPKCSVSAAEVELDPSGESLSGWLQYHGSLTGRSGGLRLYFAARLSRAPESWTVWQDEQFTPQATSASGEDVGVGLVFEASSEPVQVQIGLSYVDIEGALGNLDAELSDWDFDRVRQEAWDEWNEELSRIELAGGTEDQRVIFFSALFHALFTPTLFEDVDKRYTGFDKQIHTSEGFEYYTDFSLWDTYRTTHPLFVLLYPDRQLDMLQSVLAMYQQGGYMPKWPAGAGYTGCMIGTPADVLFGDSYIKGIVDFDAELALDALVANAETDQEVVGRDAPERYIELGYLPADEVNGSVARTLEFGVSDYAIAKMAEAMGRTDEAEKFLERSGSYINLYDEQVGFMRGRNADGSFSGSVEDFDPITNYDYFVEGDAWQYLWLAPHDPDGLAQMLGGSEAMALKLEEFFATPEPVSDISQFLPKFYYWHGNEPDIHAAYLFDAIGLPDKTQYWVRHVLDTRYSTGADGLAGNDDCGTLSAWYIFSAAGFYPIAGQDRYYIGSPLFERVVFHLQDGHTFEVEARDASAEILYVSKAEMDEQSLSVPWFTHADILNSERLVLTMEGEPTDWQQ